MIREFVFRCAQCRLTTSVQARWTDGDATEVACSTCQARFTLAADRYRGRSNDDHQNRARRYATAENIDLASAFSVLEGILPRENVRGASFDSTASRPRPFVSSRSLAVAAALAASVVLVAVQSNPSRLVQLPGAGTAAHRAPKPAEVTPVASTDAVEDRATPAAPLAFQLDDAAKLVKISGPDPRSVLAGYCTHPGHAGSLAPYAVAPAIPPSPGLRIGIVRDRERVHELASVRIWLDPRSGRWNVGSGNGPILLEPLQSAPVTADIVF